MGIKRDSETFEKDEFEMFKSGSLSDKEYVLAAPLGDDAADMIYTGVKFMEESGNSTLGTLNNAGADIGLGAPTLVTLFPGHSWNHIGGSALENQDSVEA